MTKLKNPIAIILLISFFLISTCTNDNSITGNSNQSIGKVTNVMDINSTATNDFEKWFTDLSYYYHMPPEIFAYFLSSSGLTDVMCFFVYLIGMTPEDIGTFLPQPNSNLNADESKLYNFRNNFLTKSTKGNEYIAAYYMLGRYGIENNLVNKYYIEHIELLKSSIEISNYLQHGSDNNRILINKSTRDSLIDLLKVYRNTSNHREIEPILNYLEADLEKYYNKPKYEIATDFEQN